VRVVIVFDGQGERMSEVSDPHDVQIFYAPRGQSADSIIERLASRYASRYEVTVATGDSLVMETVNASGANCVSPDGLRKLIESVEKR
jgi:predicted RNA-binding protein with PIN domain